MGFSRQEYSSEVAISFSRGSSQTRDWTWVSCTGKQILYHLVTREVHMTSSSVKSSSSIKSVFFLAISLLLNLWYGGGIGHSLAGIWSEMSFTECLQASGFPCLQLAPQGCPDQARGCWKGRSLSSKPFGASSPFRYVWLFVELPRGRTWKGLLITLFRAPEEKLNLSANSAWSRYWRDKISDGLSGTWAIWKLTLWFLWVMRHITERGKKKKTGRQEREKEEGNDLKKIFFLFCIGVFENPLDRKEVKPVNHKGNQSWISIGRTVAETEAPMFWPPDEKSRLTGKDPDAGKDWGREEEGAAEDETVGWHHWLNGHEFEQTQGDGEWQACCSP